MPSVPPPPGGDPAQERWAERRIQRLRAALPEAPAQARPAAAARLAALLFACARDDEADALLIATRHEVALTMTPRELARVEIALAASSLVRDDDPTVEARLAHARI